MHDQSLGQPMIHRPQHFRFGPFEVDSRSGELRKNGIRIPTGQQTLQVLVMLLEDPGEVVLREEIRLKLWPDDTVVEFDHSINAAIQKLRVGLGESASQPRYIETLPRRGYRFMGSLETVPAVPADEVPDSPTVPPPQVPGRKSWSAVAVATGAVMVGLLAMAWLRTAPERESAGSWAFSLGEILNEVISPDGSAVIYTDARGVILRRMNSIEEIPLSVSGRLIDTPCWSPDGSQVVLHTLSGLSRMSVPNGPQTPVWTDIGITRGCTCAADGTIVSAMISAKPDGNGLYLISPSGGSPARLEIPGFTNGIFFYPEFLPDEKDILFSWARNGDVEGGIYLARLEAGRITRQPVLLRRNMTAGHYSPSGGGRLLYVQDEKLYAHKLSAAARKLEGPPEQVLNGVFSEPLMHKAQFSVSRKGALLWRAGRAALAQLTWFNRTGAVMSNAGPVCLPDVVRLSPDERHVLLDTVADQAGYSISQADRNGFVALPGLTGPPLWMPQNSHLLYTKKERNGYRLMERALEGGYDKELARVPEIGWLLDLSMDGKSLLYHVGPKLYALRIDSPNASPWLLARAAQGKFSPDSRWVLYSAPTGNDNRLEIYAQPFPSGGLPLQLTSAGGRTPVWRGDGKEIIFWNGSSIYSLRVEAKANTLHVRPPERLFDVRVPAGLAGDSVPIAVTHDGSRILFAQGVEQPGSPSAYVMTAWERWLRH